MNKISCKNVFKNGKAPDRELFNKKIAELIRAGKNGSENNHE